MLAENSAAERTTSRHEPDRRDIASYLQAAGQGAATLSHLIGHLGPGRIRSAGSYDRIKAALPLNTVVEVETKAGMVRLQRVDTGSKHSAVEVVV